MWSLLSRKVQITVVLAAGLFAAWTIDAVYALLIHRDPGALKTFSLAVTAVATGLLFFAEVSWRWIWQRIPFLGRKAFPDLNGKWSGTLVSTWIDPETGRARDPMQVQMTIRQGLFSTSVSLRTPDAESHSTRCILERLSEIRRFRLWYSYNFEPTARARHIHEPHEGVAFVEFDPEIGVDRLIGRYYTARKTTGDIEVIRDNH